MRIRTDPRLLLPAGLGAAGLIFGLLNTLGAHLVVKTAFVVGSVLSLAVAIFWIDRETGRLQRCRRQGRCKCGYDLQGVPPHEESTTVEDAEGRFRTIRRTVICPECGHENVRSESG